MDLENVSFTVMVNLGCQLDCVWNQLRGTPLGGFLRVIPERVN